MTEALQAPPVLLRAEGLAKAYATPALVDVSLDLREGEVHALVGENGAGKSTLSRILAGVVTADGGRMLLAGESYAPTGMAQAAGRGVAIVLQELNLVETLSVAEQVLFGAVPTRLGFVDRQALRARARAALGRVGLEGLEPTTSVGSLGVGQRQMLAVAAALARPCRVLILDEPTAALSEHEAERLFVEMERLKAGGVAILYVSHRLEEIRRLADRVTVLRDGRKVATRLRGAATTEELVRLMVGREPAANPPPDARSEAGLRSDFATPKSDPSGLADRSGVTPAKLRGGGGGERRSTPPFDGDEHPVLRVRHLQRGKILRDVSFELWRGEILGLAGLMGSGRTETVRAIFGADLAEGGEIELRGTALPRPFRSPKEAVRHGIALVTENRKDEGLLLPLSIRANLTLARLGEFSRRGFLRSEAERSAAATIASRLGVKCASVEQPVAQLSGGNQQRVVLGRWLERSFDVLLCDEPTRGVDVAARAQIHGLLRELARGGKAVLVVSSEIEELRALCDRIVVLSAGTVTATFGRDGFSQDAILRAALQGHNAAKGVA